MMRAEKKEKEIILNVHVLLLNAYEWMHVHAQSNQTGTLGNGLMIQQNADNIRK